MTMLTAVEVGLSLNDMPEALAAIRESVCAALEREARRQDGSVVGRQVAASLRRVATEVATGVTDGV